MSATLDKPQLNHRQSVPHPNASPLTVSALSACLVTSLASPPALSAQLPVPCLAGNCGAGGPNTFVKSGAATATVTANTLQVNQTSNQAVLNWSSFNVSADGHVIFQQPNASSIALNRIYQQSPSSIFGQVQANGQIYLVNPNGFVFGATASVNAAGILASTLKISDSTFAAGLLSPGLLQHGQAALVADGLDNNGNPLIGSDGQPLNVSLVVEQGAQLKTNVAGGRVMLAAQNVQNAGTIQADDGQVILAAGTKAYLAASNDLALRGILVEVDGGGKAWNQLTGQLSAAHGAITMVGLAVNQDGRISASTSVSANGSVHLLARDNVQVSVTDSGTKLLPQEGGTITLGSQSHIEVNPDLNDTSTAVDEQAQLPSTVEVSGSKAYFRSGASVVAHGGDINVSTLRASQNVTPGVENYDPNSKIHVESGVTLDVSGSEVTLPMSSNFVSVQLRGNELANFPAQRNGALRGQTVVVDSRASGTRADGSTWQGTPVADVSATIAAVPKNVGQRTSAGGKVVFDSTGDLTVASGSTINLSGGVINYQGGSDESSQLITSSGRLVGIASADPNAIYAGVLQTTSKVVHDRWGVIENIPTPYVPRYIAGYQQGQAAGAVQFAAPNMLLSPTLVGTVARGPYQRSPSTAPAGGTLIIGSPNGQGFPTPDYQAPSVVFSASNPPFEITDDASLPQGLPLRLSTDYLQNGFTSTQIYSNGSVTLPEGLDLSLSPGSTLSVNARSVDVSSNIVAPGGNLGFNSVITPVSVGLPQTSGVTIGSGVTLDVRGTWTNDALVAPTALPTGLVAKDGGSIALSVAPVQSTLSIGDQANFLVSGGAWLQSSGKVVNGKGGSISILAAPTAALDFGKNIGIQGYGVGTAAGGSLSVGAAQIAVGPGSQWLQPLQSDPSSSSRLPVQIGAGLFSDYGFSNVTLTANGLRSASGSADVLTVTGGTQIEALTPTLTLSTGQYQSQASTTNISGFSRATLLAQYLRPKASVTLQAIPSDFSRVGDPKLAYGSVSVQTGASLAVDPGACINIACINIASVGGVNVDGSLIAPGGTITLTIPVPPAALDTVGYQPDLRVEVGPNAILDVSGLRVLTPTDTHPLAGTVLSGGKVSLLADRGAIDIAQGAHINAAGGSGLIDQALPTGHGFVREVVGSSGGSVNLVAAEGISISGSLNAAAGVGQTGTTPGGTLSLNITRDFAGIDSTSPIAASFPSTPRTLQVFDSAIAPVVSQGNGSGLTDGLALLDASLLRKSGVDFLNLTSDNSVVFGSGVDLSLARGLVVNTPQISVSGAGAAVLAAPYVALSDRGQHQALVGTPTSGAGQLSVTASQLDLIGAMSLQDIGKATLTSTGDIQLVGYSATGTAGSGSFSVGGDLTLRANRIYPSTATRFTLQAGNASDATNTSTLRLEQVGGPSVGTPLSAAGALTLIAGNIEQNGSLYAPFGTISLQAGNTLSLGDGSLTSTSGNGLTIPYGFVQNSTSWLYGPTQAAVKGVPTRQVTLSAPSISTAATSTVDVSGGGDLYAYEFIPGTGGTVDALQPAASPGLFAILPSLRGQYAPYDVQSYAGSSLHPGDEVYLAGAPGLPAGVYPLLPATYALLPGAFLITAVPGTTGLAPGTNSALPDGTPIVAGYHTFGQTGLGDALYSGFAIRPGSYAHNLADYQDHLASTYFADLATKQGLPKPVLPADAGRLTLAVGSRLDAAGSVNTTAASGGSGGQVELAATSLEITGSGPVTPDAGAVVVADSVLQRWNPAQLLLGGEQSADGSSINVISSSVDVSGGAKLTFGELIVVANQSINIDNGSQLASTSGVTNVAPAATSFTTPVSLSLQGAGGAGAALALSDARQLTVTNPTATAGGALHIDSSSSVASRGSILVSAPGGANVEGTVQGAGGYWTLSSGQIVFGGPAAQVSGTLVMTRALLSNAELAQSLTLASASTIDFAAPTNLVLASSGNGVKTGSSLIVAANGLRDLVPGAPVTLQADRVDIEGGSAAAPAVAGTGSLNVTGKTIGLESGTIALSGFGQTSLAATGDVVVSGSGNLTVPGDLAISASRLNVGGSAPSAWQISGAFTLSGPTVAGGQSSALQPGGALSFEAGSVQLAGSIVAPSGLIQVKSDTNLTLAPTALIDTSGISVSAAGRNVGTPGGSIDLSATGKVLLAQGSHLAVDGLLDVGGSVSITAGGAASVGGTLTGQGAAGNSGGAFALSAGSVGDFSGLVQNLQAGGFSSREKIHVSSGDLVLSKGMTASAQTVNWSTDAGSIEIAGTVQAISGTQRSSVQLSAGNAVIIDSTGRIDADAASASQAGGSILLSTTGQDIRVLRGAVLSAAGSVDGELTVRAPASAVDIAVSQLSGNFSRIGQVILEPQFSQTIPAGPIDSALTTLQATATNFMAQNESALRARFIGIGSPLAIRPAVQVLSQGDVTLGGLDLTGWRFGSGQQPVDLTIRSAGSLTVAGTVSDGFQSVGRGARSYLDLLPGLSSGITLVAGADLNAADALSTTQAAADLSLAQNAIVRTGTGNILLASARDIVFASGASVYTGGTAGALTVPPTPNSRATMSFPTGGGSISLAAGRDVVGSPVTQSIADWLPRIGSPATAVRPLVPGQWGIDFQHFGWTLGALGGGDVNVLAGRDILNVAATSADSQKLTAPGQLTEFGGGNVTLSAGRDVDSPEIYVGHGVGTIAASGAIGSARQDINNSTTQLGALLAVGNGQLDLRARGDILIETAFNPLVMPQINQSLQQRITFFTYSPDSALSAQSVAGNITLALDPARFQNFFENPAVNSQQALAPGTTLPASLFLHALSGNIELGGGAILFPSNTGQLDLFAGRDIVALSNSGTGISMSDVAGSAVPTPLAPLKNVLTGNELQSAGASGRHIHDPNPVLISAGRDIQGVLEFDVPKAAEVFAGRDIVDLTLKGQNLNAGDLTEIDAGRDILYTAAGAAIGQVQIGGPGRVDLIAGRQIDLGSSLGVTTVGRTADPALATTTGADVTLIAGLAQSLDTADLVNRVIAGSPVYQTMLENYVQTQSGVAPASFQEASTAFLKLSSDAQRPLLLDVFFNELLTSGREANATPSLGFTRGYNAINTLFPGSGAGQTGQPASPYSGDVSLQFSRIYTLAGGNISVLAPGGLVDVGLALPPAGVTPKKPSQLGIVAQGAGNVDIFTNGDVLVNSSRIFTLGGGNILIWSTQGNIDAGRGAKSSLSAPPPIVIVDPTTGVVTVDPSTAVPGSGIRTIITGANVPPGNVDLDAPAGFVNAGDAGIGSSGNLNVAAQRVLGVDNIQVGGVATGVPPATGGLGISLSGVSNVGTSASVASTSVSAEDAASKEAAPLAQTALNWLEVFVTGLGEENCRTDDVECLKRQKTGIH